MNPLEQQPIRVLLIEDNAGDIRLVSEILAEAKAETYQLEHVDEIAKGLIRLKEEDFDIILLDLSLPDGYGINTVSKVCTAVPYLPIIVLTGLDDEEVALQAV